MGSEQIIDAIVEDIKDRRGLKSEWNQIDDEIQEEIKQVWMQIVRPDAERLEQLEQFLRAVKSIRESLGFSPPEMIDFHLRRLNEALEDFE